MYLPCYLKGDASPPALFSDLACVVNLLLYKKDGSVFKSDDRYGHTCYKVGAVWHSEGMFFDGADDYVHIDDNPVLDNLLTIEAWYKPVMEISSGVSWHFIIGKNASWHHGIMQTYSYSPNRVYLEFQDSSAAVSGIYHHLTAADYPQWFHYVGMFNNNRAMVYVNGRFLGQGNVIADCSGGNNSYPLYIGGNGGTRGCYGFLGETRAYSRALTAQEVSELYLSTRWRYQ